MRWTIFLTASLLAILAAPCVLAKRVDIPVSRQVANAEAIALVRIGAVRSFPKRGPREHLVELLVLRRFKGLGSRSRRLQLEFEDHREDEPEALHPGETWLLFLHRSGAGRYGLQDWYQVHRGIVDFWPEDGKTIPLKTAEARITAYLRR